nr:hypothetical protein [Tanacetum cinerariifolium]
MKVLKPSSGMRERERERERVQNEANHAEGPNVAPVARECTFADFTKCSPITFRRNEEAIVFAAATFQDRALTWWNSPLATLGIEAVTRKTWAEMKMMMTEEFCPPEEIQRMEGELWNLRVKEMDISSYTTRFNELVILCPGMVPTERKKVEAYIRGLLENIKGEVTSSEPATLSKAVRMAHTLMEQKVKAKAEREADDKKRKMDWLILHDAVIVCGKKEVHMPLKKRTLVVKGDDCVSRLKVVSCMKVKKYVDHGSYLFVAQVIEKEPIERRLEDVPVI